MDMGSMNMTHSPSSNGTSMGDMMMMKAYLHFGGGDALLFKTIAPSSAGAIFGACLILFLIAVGERWILAISRRFAKARVVRSQRLLQNYVFDGKPADGEQSSSPTPFILSHELGRGFLAGLQVTLHYLLMLVVMTFNAAFIISVILGVVAGEIAFGRLYR
ncbi:hypothetical protein MIND_01377700 [Mycena indigotica]|uniref:Copper transport protein n=1 Tax=Mycena indigotica TaxID=2126181 RepID=A0A8H6RZC8_9AGAR|nr:uncharacterized protein MIND_01377700 [Mycena indigotica]KAF7289166.1 hypothetical protein MIND_01377700 [Mycena indigotica]